MKRASIDIGSNSILLLVAEIDGKGINVLENHSYVTGLGRDLDKNKRFLEVAMKESLEVLTKYSSIVRNNGIDPKDVIATATEASRVAQNSNEFYEKVEDETGISVKIISGEGEAHYSTMGILADQKIADKEIVIMDIGGASTEIIHVDCEKRKILNSFSMPMGAVRFNNWRESNQLDINLGRIYKSFKDQLELISTKKLYCVAGTMTSVANMYLGHKDFVELEVNGCEFTTNDVQNMFDLMENFTPQDFLEDFPFLGKRSKTIKSGIKLALTVFSWLNISEIYVSTYGLRYGTLLDGEVRSCYVTK